MPLYRLCWKLLISSRESCLVLQLQMPLCPCLDIIIKGKFEPKHQVLPAFNGIIRISIESRKSWCFGNLAPSLNFFQKFEISSDFYSNFHHIRDKYSTPPLLWDTSFYTFSLLNLHQIKKPNGSFKICSSLGFRNTPYILNLI